jgi:hypothetical protein
MSGEVIAPLLPKILTISEESATCEEPVFVSYWTEISALRSIMVNPTELSTFFVSRLQNVMNVAHLTAYAKLTALNVVANCLGASGL